MDKEINLSKEIDSSPIQSDLFHVFEFKKDPDTGLKKIVNKVKRSSTALLFGSGVATGYFIYNHTPFFEIVKYALQFGLDAIALLLVASFILQLKQAPKELSLKEKFNPYLRKTAFAAIGCVSLATLIALMF